MSALTEKCHNFTCIGQNATFPLHSTERRGIRQMLYDHCICAKDDSISALTAKYHNFTCIGQNATFPLQSKETREKLKGHPISAKDDLMSALTGKYQNSTSKVRTRLSHYTQLNALLPKISNLDLP
jgi:hypothetical protein